MWTGTSLKKYGLVSAVLLAAVLAHRGAEAAELKVCVDKSNPASAMDVRVAQAVAKVEQDTLAITYFDGMGDGDDGLSDRRLVKLVTACGLMLGYPEDAKSLLVPQGLQATAPYGLTGFVLVTRRGKATSLDELPSGSVVGVTYLTAPNLYFAAHPKISAEIFLDDQATLAALKRGRVAAAMMWRPFVARQMELRQAGQLRLSVLNEPHANFNLVGLYVDSARPEAEQFQKSVEQLRGEGTLGKLLQPYAEAAPAVTSALQRLPRHRFAAWNGGRLYFTSSKKHAAAAPAGPPPALFTDAQAAAGKQTFDNDCAMCHGPNLEGRAGPALKGPTFATPEAKFTVSDVFHIVSLNMPAPAPGTLSHDEYVNIMSYLLQQNGYPSGGTALDFDTANKSKVKLLYHH